MSTLSVTKSLIHSYFAGHASPVQKSLIKDWLKKEENQELYFEWLAEWQTHSPHYILDGDIPVNKFVDFMAANSPVNTLPDRRKREHRSESISLISFGNRWLMAATILLTLGIAFLSGRDYVYYKEYQTTFGETRTIRLTDGTSVILNANSLLTVPRFGFGTRNRTVSLKGEAFFVVTHTIDNRKFLVKTDKNLEVMVYGTEFSVSTEGNESKVLLKNGKVHLRYAEGKRTKEVVMKPGDLITIDKQKKPVLKPHVDAEKLIAWTEHRFVFDRMHLKDVGSLIKKHFGINVLILDPAMTMRTVSGTFQADSADELVTILADMFDFKFSRQRNTIIISAK